MSGTDLNDTQSATEKALQDSQERLTLNEARLARQARQLEGVAQISAAASTLQDVDQLLQTAVDLTKSYLSLYHAHIYLLNDSGTLLTLTAGADDIGRQMVAEGRTIPLAQEQSLVARAARIGQAVIINDVQEASDFLPHPLLPETRAEMAVPMVASGRVLGVLDVQSQEVDYFTAQDAYIITTLASQIGIAIENAHRFTKLQTQAQELQKTTTFLDSVVENLPVMLFIKDAEELRFVRWNKAGEEIVGYSRAEMLGKNDFDFFAPEQAEFFIQKDREVLDNGEVLDIPEESIVTAHQGTRFLHTRKVPILDAQGIPHYLLGISEDITERKQVEQHLQESLERYNLLLNFAPDPIVLYDVEGRVISLNKAFENVFGWTESEVRGQRIDFVPDDEKANTQEAIRLLFEVGQTVTFQTKRLTKDGRMIPVAVHADRVRDSEGNFVGSVVSLRDETTRRAAEQQLRDSEALLRTVIDSTPDWIFVKDREHRYRLVNKSYADSLSMNPEDLIGKTDLEIGFPETIVKGDPDKGITGYWADDQAVMDSGLPKAIAEQPVVSGNQTLYFRTFRTPMRDENGQVNGVLAFVRNITERKQAEEIAAASRAQLAEALRIAQLANWEYDVLTDTFTFNDQFYALLRTTAEREGGYTMSSAHYAQRFVYPDDAALVGMEIQKVLETTDPNFSSQVDHRIIYADGEVGYITVRFRVQQNEAGRTIKTYGANQDITERKRAEEILRANEEKLTQAANLAKIAYWELDLHSMDFTFNDQFYNIIRTTAQSAGGYVVPAERYLRQFVHPEDAAYIQERIQAALHPTGLQNQIEYRTVCGDGQIQNALLQFRIVYDAEKRPVKVVGAHMDITDRKHIEDTSAKQAHELEAVAQISAAASAIQETNQLLQSVVDLTKGYFDLYHAHIYLLNEPGDTLVLTAGAGDVGRQMVQEGRTILLNHERSLVARAARDRQAVIVNDVRAEADFLPHPLLPHTRAEMAVPLLVAGRVLGVMDIQDDTPGIFTAQDANIMATLSSQVGVALQNARSFEQYSQTLTKLNLSQSQLAEALRITQLANWEYDVPTDTFTFNDQFYTLLRTSAEQEGGYTMSSGRYAQRFVHPDDANLVGQEIGKALTTTDPNFSTQVDHRIIYADGEVGYVTVRFRIQKDAQGQTVKTFGANQIITERKQAENLLEKQARELDAVARISTAASTIQETDHLLQTVVDLTKGYFALYHAHIYLLNEQGDTLVLTTGAGEVGRKMVAEGRTILVNLEQSLVARAARTRQAVIVNDVREALDFLPNPLLPDTRAEMAVPLLVGGRALGVLDIQSDTPNQFTTQDANIMSTLASQVGIALQNTRSFERYEQTLAELNLLTRRLTREAWDDYLKVSPEEMQFAYGVQPTLAEPTNGTNGHGLTRPIAIQGEVIGKLDLLEPNIDADEADEIIAAVAERLSTHLENLRLTEQTQYALSQTEALYLGSSRVAGANSVQEVMDALVKSTALSQLDRANIILFNQPWAHEMPETGTVIAVWERDGQPPRAPVGTVYQARLFPSIQLFSASHPTLFHDVATDERLDPNLRSLLMDRLGMRCFFVFPFVVSGQWWGFISSQASQPIYLSEEEIRQVSSLADQAATVVQTLRLFEQANVRAEQLAILNEMARDLTIALDVDSALETVHHYTDLLMEARYFYIAFYDNDAQTFTFPIVIEDGQRITWEPRPFTNDLNEYIIHSGQGLLIRSDIEGWAKANDVTLTELTAKSWVGMPLKLANTILGVVALHNPTPYAFDQNSFDLLSSVANQGSIAIQNARLFEQTQNALAETETLYRATGDINASRRYYEIINVLRNYTLGQQPVKNVTLNLFDRPWSRGQIFPWVEVAERLSDAADVPVGTRFNLAEFPSASLILNQEEPIFISDLVTDARIDSHTREIYHDRLGANSVIFIPLVAGGQWLGFVDVLYETPVGFAEVELRRMLALTGQAAVATQNLRNLEVAQQRAQEAQARREESELLYNLSAQLTAANTLDDVLRIVMSPAIDAGARSGILALFPGEATDEPVLIDVVAGWSAKNKYLLAPDTQWQVKEHAHLQFLLRYPRSPLYVHDTGNDIQVPSAAARKFLARHGTKALVCLPLNIGRRRLGMILLEWETPRVFTNVEQRLYHSVAGQAAVVVDNRQLLVATQTRAAQLDKLSRIETSLSLADTDEEILLAVLPSCNTPHTVIFQYI